MQAARRAIFEAPFLLLFVALLMLSLRQISDPDIWFYLTIGREIAGTGSIPTREFYLFPALGEPASYSAWGYGLLHYVVFQAAGYTGMAFLNSALIAGAMTFMVGAALPQERKGFDWAAALLALAAAYACLDFRLSYRPESTLYLLMALEVLLLERWLADGRVGRLFVLPPLAWGISQLHTTAVLLVLVYGAYVCHWALERLRAGDGREIMRLPLLVAIGLAMALLPMINPNGLEQVIVLFRSLGEGTSANVEYLPIWQTQYRWHFVVFAAAVGLGWLVTPGRRVVDALLLAGFGWLAFRYVRNLGLFALVAVMPLTRILAYHASGLVASVAPVKQRAIAGGAVLAGASGLVAVAVTSGSWGVGVREDMFFARAVETIRKISTGGNVMNFFHHGGYLAWALGPNYRAAVDGHFVRKSFAEEYHDRVMRADPDWRGLLQRFRVGVVVSPATLPYSGHPIPLVERLVDDSRWRLLGVESAGLLFVHEAIAANGGVPALDKREVWQQMKREGEKLLVEYPGHAEARRVIALAEQRLNASAGMR